MWSGAWNKRKLTSEISNRFLPSSVSRAWDWWSGGCELKPHWGQFLTKFILCCVTLDLSDNLTEMCQIGLSWKTQLSFELKLVCVVQVITVIQPRNFEKKATPMFHKTVISLWAEPHQLLNSVCIFSCSSKSLHIVIEFRALDQSISSIRM